MFKTLKKKLTVQEGSKCLLIYDYSISFSANNKLQGWTHTHRITEQILTIFKGLKPKCLSTM